MGICVVREACTSGSISKEQGSALVLPIATFINSCDTEQIRLAPDKCIILYSFILDLCKCC